MTAFAKNSRNFVSFFSAEWIENSEVTRTPLTISFNPTIVVSKYFSAERECKKEKAGKIWHCLNPYFLEIHQFLPKKNVKDKKQRDGI